MDVKKLKMELYQKFADVESSIYDSLSLIEKEKNSRQFQEKKV